MGGENRTNRTGPKKECALSFDGLSGGLNLWELDYRLRRSESPEMKNLIWLDDTARGAAYAMYERPFHGRLIFHAGGRLYAFDLRNDSTALLAEGLPENGGSFFIYSEKLFYKTRGAYLGIGRDSGTDALTAAPVTPYTPVTVINADPDDGAGDLYQPENRLSAEKTLWYSAKTA